MFLWRISEYPDLSGAGGMISPGRWHRKLRPVVYTSMTAPGALLETLVHVDPSDAPDSLNLIKLEAPDDLAIHMEFLATALMMNGWGRWTQDFGDRWLDEGHSALLRVPSIIMPECWNVILNPAHPDARHVKVVSVERFRVDPRLF